MATGQRKLFKTESSKHIPSTGSRKTDAVVHDCGEETDNSAFIVAQKGGVGSGIM